MELHWRILLRFFSFPLDFDRLRERLEPVSLGGATVPNLAPEDLLLILCAHGTKHCWGRLGWICDVAELVRGHQGMDWEWVMEQADSLGSERALLLGLLLARNFLGTALPGTVLRLVPAGSAVISLAAQVHDRLFQDAQGQPDLFATSLFHLRAKERMTDRLRYCFRLATTPRVGDWMLLSLPAFFSFLYYPLRAIRLLVKYGPRGLKHLPAFLTIFWRK